MTLIDPSTRVSMQSTFEVVGRTLTRRHTWGDVVAESTIELVKPLPKRDTDLLGAWLMAHLRGQRPVSTRLERAVVRTVDLFCGPGGLGLGFQRACDELGIDTVSNAAVDQDAEALQVYTANHTTRRRSSESVSTLVDYQVLGQGDKAEFVYEPELTSDDWADLVGRTDVVLAGPPCQGHSNLNNKTRRNDKRNELYLTVPAMAIALRAPVVIIENVPAVIHDRQQVVGSTVRILEDAGYTVEGGVLKADRMGWAQTRQRYFLVARLDAAPIPIATVASALQADPHDVLWAIGDLATRPYDDGMHLQTEMSAENVKRIQYLFQHRLHDLPPSERPDCHKDGTTYNAVYGRMYGDRPAPTITTGFMTPGRGRYIHPEQHRVLTPWEAARIQGFPDDYRFRVDPANPPSKAKLAKWIGDAVPMPLGHAAGLAALLPGWTSR